MKELYEKMKLNVFMSIYNTKELINLFEWYKKEYPKDCFPSFYEEGVDKILETLEDVETALDSLT